MKSFRELKVWQKAHELVIDIYKMTAKFPDNERFGLISQIRRSAVSIPANIVEGFKRKGRGDFLHFLNIADASLEETKYFIILSEELKYLDNNKFQELTGQADEIGKMLNGLQKKVAGELRIKD